MKLHLGCGKRFIPGFKHIDALEFPHIDVVSTIDSLPMFDSNSVDLIYNAHVLEHFNRKQISAVLAEWRRVLKPKGILRIAVPNFAECARLYNEGKATLDQLHGLIFGGQTYLYNFHWTAFDKSTLTRYLNDVGFYEIREWDWRKTEHSNIDDFSQCFLPHMDKENGTLMSLNLEAVK